MPSTKLPPAPLALPLPSVPTTAVMLLLPHLHGSHAAGVTLALVCTFAGNLLLVGSIANLIMVDLARQAGIHIGWRQHVRTGLPVAAGSLLLLWAWLRWGMG